MKDSRLPITPRAIPGGRTTPIASTSATANPAIA